jgi:hypothetical protein
MITELRKLIHSTAERGIIIKAQRIEDPVQIIRKKNILCKQHINSEQNSSNGMESIKHINKTQLNKTQTSKCISITQGNYGQHM